MPAKAKKSGLQRVYDKSAPNLTIADKSPTAPLNRPKRRNPEEALQIQLVSILRLMRPAPFFMHIPNGGRRSAVEGARFKAMGVLPGAPDLLFILPDGRAAFLELKAGKNKLTADQEAFQWACRERWVNYCVAYTLEEALEAVSIWHPKASLPRVSAPGTSCGDLGCG